MTDQVVATFVKEPLSEASLEQLEEHLLESDLGPAASARIVERFRGLKFGKDAPEREVKEALAEAVAAELSPRQADLRSAKRAQTLCRPVRRGERLGQDHDPGQDRRRPDGQGRQGDDRRRRHLPRRRARATEGLGRTGERRISKAVATAPTPPAWPSTPIRRRGPKVTTSS